MRENPKGALVPTVFASVSVTVILLYLLTMGLAYSHLFPLGAHMLLGLFTSILIILLQCLIFGFFIGSGKSMKKKVQELGLDPDWIQKTKDYKNRSYPALMLAILLSVTAAVLGGAVSTGALPVWLHAGSIWLALLSNARSLWISYRVIVDNVNDIHEMNRQIQRLGSKDSGSAPPKIPSPEPPAAALPKVNAPANLYFLALAVWVPYLYMRFSLGSRTFPFWPFLALSAILGAVGWWKSRTSNT